MPEELCPGDGTRGKLSYTVRFPNGCVIEILLKGRAFMIKKPATGAVMPDHLRISWGSDLTAAWQETKEACNWVE